MGKWLAGLSFLWLVACSGGESGYPARTMPDGMFTASAQQSARAMFLRNCAYCHGKVDEGRSPRQDYHPPAPDFTERHYQKKDPAYLYWRIETGKTVEPYRSRGSVMPAWGPYLNSIEIWQLVAFIKQRASYDLTSP